MNIERKISRRGFLIGAVSAAVLAGCKKLESFTPIPQPSLTPIEKPTETSQPTPTKAPQPTDTSRPTTVPTPEATSTPEPKRISATTITQEYLKSAFAGIGGGEMVEGEKEKMSVMEFGQKYVSDAWGKEVDFNTLPEDPIASLKYLVSLGSYRGEEGIFSPGKQGEEVIFPQLADLSLARLTLKNIPSQTEQEYKEWITPLNFLLRPGTQMTVVGEFKTREEAEFNYALVAFTDYQRASEEAQVPRHYLVIIPTLTLANLLEANKYEFNPKTDEITIAGENGQKTILELNQIKSEELTDKIRKACGLYFVDQIKGELIKNPVVPYPQEIPSVWEIEEVKDKEGNVNLILRGQDQEGKFQDFSRARYDGEKEEWVWEKTVLPEPTLEPGEVLIGKDFIGLPDEKIVGMLEAEPEKFIVPCFVEENTSIISMLYPDSSNKYFIVFKDIKQQIIFSPVISGVKFETVMAGEEALVYYTMKENGFIISILNPQNEGSVKVINPEEEDKVPFGTILAKGFKDRLGRDGGKASVVVFLSFQPIGNNPMDYLLKYKGRIVVRKAS